MGTLFAVAGTVLSASRPCGVVVGAAELLLTLWDRCVGALRATGASGVSEGNMLASKVSNSLSSAPRSAAALARRSSTLGMVCRAGTKSGTAARDASPSSTRLTRRSVSMVEGVGAPTPQDLRRSSYWRLTSRDLGAGATVTAEWRGGVEVCACSTVPKSPGVSACAWLHFDPARLAAPAALALPVRARATGVPA
jgi:hypothetical protein